MGDGAPSLTGNPQPWLVSSGSELWSVEGACKTSAHTEQRTGLSGTLEIADVGAQMSRRYRVQSQAVRWKIPPSEESTSDGGTTRELGLTELEVIAEVFWAGLPQGHPELQQVECRGKVRIRDRGAFVQKSGVKSHD